MEHSDSEVDERIQALLDEVKRLRTHIELIVASHPLAAEYEYEPQDPKRWILEEE